MTEGFKTFIAWVIIGILFILSLILWLPTFGWSYEAWKQVGFFFGYPPPKNGYAENGKLEWCNFGWYQANFEGHHSIWKG